MLLDADDSQLLLIDFQTRLLSLTGDADAVLGNARRLARIAGLLALPVWAAELESDSAGAFDAELRGCCDRVIGGSTFNACGDALTALLRPPQQKRIGGGGNARSLPKHLRQASPQQQPAAAVGDGRDTIVLAGCEAHIGLLQTALGLQDEEFDVWVVTDACGARTERNRDAAFDRLAGAGVELVTTEMVAFEWLPDTRHPAYQQVLALLR